MEATTSHNRAFTLRVAIAPLGPPEGFRGSGSGEQPCTA